MGYGTPFKNIVRDAEPLCAIAPRLIYDTQRLLQTIEALERGRAGRGAPLTTSLRDEAAPPAGRSPSSSPATGTRSHMGPSSSPEPTDRLWATPVPSGNLVELGELFHVGCRTGRSRAGASKGPR